MVTITNLLLWPFDKILTKIKVTFFVLQKYVGDHHSEDSLLNGFQVHFKLNTIKIHVKSLLQGRHPNPFRERSSCTVLWPLTIVLNKQYNLLKIFYVLLSVYSVQLLSVYKLNSKLTYNGNLKYCYLYFSNQLFSRN